MRFYSYVSVEGTGTRFLGDVLTWNDVPPLQRAHTHLGDLWKNWFTDRVLCPMRDPMLHAIGQLNRGKPVRFDEIEALAALANERTHFFCVDAADRAEEERGLATWLGLTGLRIRWSSDRWFRGEDRSGRRARYEATGELPDPTWPTQIGERTRGLLHRLGYRMNWLTGDFAHADT